MPGCVTDLGYSENIVNTNSSHIVKLMPTRPRPKSKPPGKREMTSRFVSSVCGECVDGLKGMEVEETSSLMPWREMGRYFRDLQGVRLNILRLVFKTWEMREMQEVGGRWVTRGMLMRDGHTLAE
jgi:hypothetical protein